MTSELIKMLEECGFKPYITDCDLMSAFKNRAYCLDTKMLVRGDHATDCAELIYAHEENFKGLCYAPSLIEYMLLDFQDKEGIKRIIKRVGKAIGAEIELEFIGIFPMVTIRCDETDFEIFGLNEYVSDMLKVIGILDYLLQNRVDYLRKKQVK